jgi:hypothetical protein
MSRHGAHNGVVRPDRIRRVRVAAGFALSCAITLAVIALAPVIILVGEPLRRYYLQRLGLRPGPARRLGGGRLGRVVVASPVMIALTAPGRWAMDRAAAAGSGGSGRGGFGPSGGRGAGGGPPPADVREPRRPRPTAPAGAIALAEPKQQRVIPILKAHPPALSKAARRVGSRLRRLALALRARVRPPAVSRSAP